MRDREMAGAVTTIVATLNTAGAVDASSRFYKRWQPRRCRAWSHQAVANVETLADMLAAHHVGIVALQETDTSFSGQVALRQWEHMAARLGMTCRFTSLFDINWLGAVRVRSGIAVLSAFPIVASESIALPQAELLVLDRIKRKLVGPRSALRCTLRVGASMLHVINVHLTHHNARQRERELAVILDYAVDLRGPTLLMGDFNFTPAQSWPEELVHPQPLEDTCLAQLVTLRRSRSVRVLADERLGPTFVPTPDEMAALATCPANAPRYKFDWIFGVDPGHSLSLGPEMVLPAVASDHRPLLAPVTLLSTRSPIERHRARTT